MGYDSHNTHLHAFDSPASVPLSSPVRDKALSAALDSPTSYDLFGILPAEPDSASLPFMSPPANDPTEPDMMNSISGGALAPRGPMPPAVRPSSLRAPGLRLPSFEELGIATLHSDRHGEPLSAPVSSLTEAFRDVQLGAGSDDALSQRRPLGEAVKAPVTQFIETLTPPADRQLSLAAVPVPMYPSAVSRLEDDSSADSSSSALPSHPSSSEIVHPRLWYEGAVDALLANISAAPTHNSALKIISHALPSPSTSGHVFPTIISRINNSAPVSPTTPLTWINVFHAIPGRFNLADLPTSPPATPGPAIGGEDYFTQKVFDSAVSISDYQDDLSSLPRSPRPIVPPSTIDVSIVERYIPPSTSNEFAEMFNPNGPSILVDRLVELSPNNGSLVFVYPTRDGAQTFMREYLGPVIDPILRTMVVVHGLSSDLSRTLGRMVAVNQLPDFETMHRRVVSLCTRLTQQSTTAQRFSGRRPHFTVSYASREHVELSREAWSKDWWTKQEKQRVRDVVKRYSQEAQTKRSNEHVERAASSTELLQEVLKGVCEKPHPSGMEPEEGIEVSVFVIKRSE